jgi:L-2,4-diaminobutyrate decarboxylase
MSLISQAYDPSSFREQAHQLVDLLADHLENTTTRKESKTIPFTSPQDAYQYWKNDYIQGTNDDPSLLFNEIIAGSTKLHHPRFMGHQVGVVAPVSAMASMLTALLNNGTAVYEMGMSSNALERICSEILARRIGFDTKAGGILTSGGTLANLTALLAARARYTNAWGDGNINQYGVMVSEEAHYCIDRAARIMGWGSEGIIKIPVDHHFKMKTELLDQYYLEATSRGIKIIAIVGSACSTSTGAYDDLSTIASFAEQKDLWFHVDGAHGGCVVFSDKYKHLVNGVNRADSVVIDWHKMLMTPALVTALIFKDGSDAHKTFHQKADYIFSSQMDDWYNSGKRTFECTKLMMSIKVYSILKTYGEEICTEYVETVHQNAETLAKMVVDRPNFELGVQPESNIVCFRYDSTRMEKDLNPMIRQRLIDDGKFYIVQTLLKDKFFLRVSLMNPLTEKQDLNYLLDEVERLANELNEK